jgi:DnaJ-class molecular chaperone
MKGTAMSEVTICNECYGNGFVRVPSIYADQWEVAQCDVCHSSGEVQSSFQELEKER